MIWTVVPFSWKLILILENRRVHECKIVIKKRVCPFRWFHHCRIKDRTLECTSLESWGLWDSWMRRQLWEIVGNEAEIQMLNLNIRGNLSFAFVQCFFGTLICHCHCSSIWVLFSHMLIHKVSSWSQTHWQLEAMGAVKLFHLILQIS